MHHILQDVYQENTVNILPLLQENAAAGLGTPIHVPLENILQNTVLLIRSGLKENSIFCSRIKALCTIQIQNRERGTKMEITSDLLALLKELLDICGEEAKRAREAEQTHERIQNVVIQVHKILEKYNQ